MNNNPNKLNKLTKFVLLLIVCVNIYYANNTMESISSSSIIRSVLYDSITNSNSYLHRMKIVLLVWLCTITSIVYTLYVLYNQEKALSWTQWIMITSPIVLNNIFTKVK